MNNKEIFRLKTGARHIPQAGRMTLRSEPELLVRNQLAKGNSKVHELFERDVFFPPFKQCGLKEGCWELVFVPKQLVSPHLSIFSTRYKGTMRVERHGMDHTISADLYKFRKYLFELQRIGVPIRAANRWQNLSFEPEFENFRLPRRKNCSIYPRNKYHSYLEGTDIQYGRAPFNGRCSFTISFDQWYYTHPASGFDGDFPNSPNRTVRMVLNEVSDTEYSGTMYDGDIELGTININWCSKYFRTAHLEIFTLEGAEHPPESVPDGSGGTESFESIFESAGWKLYVERNQDKLALPDSLSGIDINECWDHADLHDLMDSTPGYDNTELDKKWRVFLISVPAELGCSRGVVFDQNQSNGDVNGIDREGSATFSHDGFNQSSSSNYGAAEDELMKDWPRAFLRSAAHEVGHAFNQYHQSAQNSIMCPTPSVANALASAGETFPGDINLAFNATVRHKLIHQPDPAVRPGGMDWATAFNVPEADDINFFDAEDLELNVSTSKSRVNIGEPVELAWKLKNKMEFPVRVAGSVASDQHTTRISVTKANGDIVPMRLPLDTHDDAHELQLLASDKSIAAKTYLFWSRNGFAFDQPGQHTINITLIWQDNGVNFAVEGEVHIWVNFPVTERDNDIASQMMREDVGQYLLGLDKRKRSVGAKRVDAIVSKYKKHDIGEALARWLKTQK